MSKILPLLLVLGLLNGLHAQVTNLVTYAGNDGKETFYDVLQITDGTFLVSGYADNLDWVASDVPRTELAYNGLIPNALGSNRYGFLLHLSADLQQVLHVVHFPKGAVEDIRFLKTTAQPYTPTGDLYLSCNTADTKANDGGYLIARLDHNFVDAVPSSLLWWVPVWAESVAKEAHPWDVTNDGRVYYVSGQSHAYDWAALYCLDANGQRTAVENWRTHWLRNGTEWRGTPASANPLGSADSVSFSGIVLKSWGRCEMRSWTEEEFNALYPDGNGGLRKGAWPADFFFNAPCDPASPSAVSPGYNGYSPQSCCPVWGASSVVVDRRNNHVFLGMNFKSYAVPESSPDFEPAVLAFDHTGQMQWWSRLYHEITPAGDTVRSIPDQYVDALAIDYAHDQLVVGARSHGNNVENLWEGNTVAANSSAAGFQNRFTGTNGNIHLSWLGKLGLNDGSLQHATYFGELAEGTGSLGTPHPDPNLDGWPNPNSGWPDVNTTRMAKNALKVSSAGDVCVLAVGRRTITTTNAYQKMVKPAFGGKSCWNNFVRVYDDALRVPKYSSLVVGVWDTLTQAGGSNVDLFGVYKTNLGVVCVGRQVANASGVAEGNNLPVVNVTPWGQATPSGESAVLVYYQAEKLFDDNDLIISGLNEPKVFSSSPLRVIPNPASDRILVSVEGQNGLANCQYQLSDGLGRSVRQGVVGQQSEVSVAGLPAGSYDLQVWSAQGTWRGWVVVQ